MQKFAWVVFALVAAALVVAGQDDCADGIISDTGIPYESMWSLQVDAVASGCPSDAKAYGGTWLQLVEVPRVPFRIDHVCTALTHIGGSTTACPSSLFPVVVEARVMVYEANFTATGESPYPHPASLPNTPVFKSAPVNISAHSPTLMPLNMTYQTIPVGFGKHLLDFSSRFFFWRTVSLIVISLARQSFIHIACLWA
jgi:hypothetical protein